MSTALFEIAPPDPAADHPGAIESAVIATLDELDAAGMLTGKYVAIGEALRQTSRAVDKGMAFGKVSVATAQMTKQVFDALDKLPEPATNTGSGFDTLDATLKALTVEALTA